MTVSDSSTQSIELPGNGRRIAFTAALLLVMVASIVWLVAGFKAPNLQRSTAGAAEPAATLTSCGMEPIGPAREGPSGGPTNVVAEKYRSEIPAARVTVVNPTGVEQRVAVTVDFGGKLAPGSTTADLAPNSTRVLVVSSTSADRSLAPGVCKIDARFR